METEISTLKHQFEVLMEPTNSSWVSTESGISKETVQHRPQV